MPMFNLLLPRTLSEPPPFRWWHKAKRFDDIDAVREMCQKVFNPRVRVLILNEYGEMLDEMIISDRERSSK